MSRHSSRRLASRLRTTGFYSLAAILLLVQSAGITGLSITWVLAMLEFFRQERPFVAIMSIVTSPFWTPVISWWADAIIGTYAVISFAVMLIGGVPLAFAQRSRTVR